MDRIAVRSISKQFAKTKALKSVSFSINKGVNIVLGPNGAGKSTLLKCIDGLYRVDSGNVSINGSDPYKDPSLHNYLALMTDNYALYDYLSVMDNLKFFGRLYGLHDKEIKERSIKMLRGLNALKYADAKVYTLSRGTKQKVTFCRTAINNPRILLLDEPTAFLDAGAADYIRSFMLDHAKDGITLFVTQRIDEVTRFNSRMIVLREGRLIKDSTTSSIYGQIFRGSLINIRLAKPISPAALKKIEGIVDANETSPTYIKVRVDNYKEINKVVQMLIDADAYIVSIDYTEPMLESLYSGK